VTDVEGLIDAARVLAGEDLVDAFGHVSVRRGGVALMTPPRPLGLLRPGESPVRLTIDAEDLPPEAAKEAWIHLEIYRSRPDVIAVCRAQPPAVAATGVADLPIRALHGQGGFLGREIPVSDEARLVRTRRLGRELAAALGQAPAVVMRGNGAVTVASSAGRAAALMYVLERSAQLNLEVAGATRTPHELTDLELEAWQGARDELLDRLWAHLRDRLSPTR
jgi:HCOMODA/2-hydroxy-3-carboxy-muconic semialdehyde decarboxylase